MDQTRMRVVTRVPSRPVPSDRWLVTAITALLFCSPQSWALINPALLLIPFSISISVLQFSSLLQLRLPIAESSFFHMYTVSQSGVYFTSTFA